MPHQFLIGNWLVTSQDPSEEELMKMMTNSVEVDVHGLKELSTHYAISETEIVISVKGVPVLGGDTRMTYAVEGNCLFLRHRARGLWSRMFAAYQPDYFDFKCRDSQLELVSNPITAYHNKQIRYQLSLVD